MHIFKKYKSDSDLYVFQRIQIFRDDEYIFKKMCSYNGVPGGCLYFIIQIVNTETERKSKILFSLRFEAGRDDPVIPPEYTEHKETAESI